jgi:hypothetical protein
VDAPGISRGCALQQPALPPNHTQCGHTAWLDSLHLLRAGSPAGSHSFTAPIMVSKYIHLGDGREGRRVGTRCRLRSRTLGFASRWRSSSASKRASSSLSEYYNLSNNSVNVSSRVCLMAQSMQAILAIKSSLASGASPKDCPGSALMRSSPDASPIASARFDRRHRNRPDRRSSRVRFLPQVET